MIRLNFLAASLLVFLSAVAGAAQSSGFTYQGALSDGGTLVNGVYDLQFSLWDSLSGGSQIGSTQTVDAASVSNGIFAVTLNFGASAFPGANRFLEISTRPTGVGSFTLLSPRQQITSTPYAIRAGATTLADTATNATQLGGVAASQYVQMNDARLSDPRPPNSGSGNYIQNTNSQQSASFNINGNGTAAGTVSGEIVNAATQYNVNGKRALLVDEFDNTLGGFGTGSGGSSNTFFGRSARAVSAGQGNQNSFFGYKVGLVNTSGFQNAFFGTQVGTANTTGGNNVFIGTSAASSNTTGSNNLVIGAYADTGSGSLSNASAIGFSARVTLPIRSQRVHQVYATRRTCNRSSAA